MTNAHSRPPLSPETDLRNQMMTSWSRDFSRDFGRQILIMRCGYRRNAAMPSRFTVQGPSPNRRDEIRKALDGSVGRDTQLLFSMHREFIFLARTLEPLRGEDSVDLVSTLYPFIAPILISICR